MNQGEGSGLPPPSYPSPTAAQQMGPWGMPHQQPLSAEDAQLQQQLSGAVRSNMSEGMDNGTNIMGQVMGPGQGVHEFGPIPKTSSPQMDSGHYDANQQGGNDLNQDLSFGPDSTRRKRSKVSRACDECRRKKIRCDATNESGLERCSNCQRTQQTCQFSRVPMKRGPSKGYIKELAERLNSLENQMQPIQPMPPGGLDYQGVADESSPHGYEQYSPIDAGSLSRKRTFSMAAEGGPTGFANQFQQRDRMPSMGSWSNQGQVYQTQRPSFSVPQPQPQPKPDDLTSPFWFKGHMDSAALDMTEGVQTNPDFPWDDDSIEAYYKSIHGLLPVLHHSRTELRSHLTRCSLTLRDTFLAILYSTVRVALKGNDGIPVDDTAMKQALLVLQASQFEDPKSRSISVNLIYLQCMVLAILETDHRGPANLRGKSSLPKVQLLQMATGLGHALVTQFDLVTPRQFDGDRDSVKNLIRRNWIILVILDRFNAISTASMRIISKPMARFGAIEKPVLGGTLLYLADLTTVMSQLVGLLEMQRTPAGLSNYIDTEPLQDFLECSLERGPAMQGRQYPRNGDEASGNPNFDTEGLLWYHLLLILKRHLYIMHPRELLNPSKVMVDILSRQTSSGPFHIHFYALAVITLLELTDVPECSDEAWKTVNNLLVALDHRSSNPSVLSSPPQSPKTTNSKAAGKSISKDTLVVRANTTPGWDDAIRDLILKKQQQHEHKSGRPSSSHDPNQVKSPTTNNAAPATKAGRSLQQLADLAEKVGGTSSTGGEAAQEGPATGKNEGKGTTVTTNEPMAIDFTMLTKMGYLTVLA